MKNTHVSKKTQIKSNNIEGEKKFGGLTLPDTPQHEHGKEWTNGSKERDKEPRQMQ